MASSKTLATTVSLRELEWELSFITSKMQTAYERYCELQDSVYRVDGKIKHADDQVLSDRLENNWQALVRRRDRYVEAIRLKQREKSGVTFLPFLGIRDKKVID